MLNKLLSIIFWMISRLTAGLPISAIPPRDEYGIQVARILSVEWMKPWYITVTSLITTRSVNT